MAKGLLWIGGLAGGLLGLAAITRKDAHAAPSDGGVSVETELNPFQGESGTAWFIASDGETTVVHDKRRRPIIQFGPAGAEQLGGTTAQVELALKDFGLAG